MNRSSKSVSCSCENNYKYVHRKTRISFADSSLHEEQVKIMMKQIRKNETDDREEKSIHMQGKISVIGNTRKIIGEVYDS